MFTDNFCRIAMYSLRRQRRRKSSTKMLIMRKKYFWRTQDELWRT